MKKFMLVIIAITLIAACKKEGTKQTYTILVQASQGSAYRINVGDGKPARENISTSSYTEDVTYIVGNSTNVSAQYVPFASKNISIYISHNGKSVANASGVSSVNLNFIPSAK